MPGVDNKGAEWYIVEKCRRGFNDK